MTAIHDALAWNQFLEAGFSAEVAVPIAAITEQAIFDHVGTIEETLHTDKNGRKALIVKPYERENEKTLAVFDHTESEVFFCPKQVWVHVDLRLYRAAYLKAFPSLILASNDVLDHVLNRHAARVLGFTYIRLVVVPRRVNSEHGSLNEVWQNRDVLGDPIVRAKRIAKRGNIRYADWADLVKMLKIGTGGSYMPEISKTLPMFEGKRSRC